MADDREEKTLEQLEEENKMLRRLLAEKENAEIKKALLECDEDSEESNSDAEWMRFIQEDAQRRSANRARIVLIVVLVIFGLWAIGQYTLSHLNYTITIG